MADNSGFLPTIGKIVNNGLGEAGNMINGVMNIPSNLINEYKTTYDLAQRAKAGDQQAVKLLQQRVDQAKQNGTLDSVLQNQAVSTVSNFNQDLGDPLQGGDVAGRIGQHFVNHPLTTTLDALSLVPAIKGVRALSEGADIAKGADVAATGAEAVPQAAKGVARVTLKPSVYGAGREAAVQDTVDNLIPGANATEKYANLQPTMDRLGQQINQVMAQNPKSASLDQIMSDYDKNLNNEGIYRNSDVVGSLTDKRSAVQKEAQSYITDLYNTASDQSGEVVPSSIPDYALQNLKQQISKDMDGIYKKIENGSTLTDKDRVKLVARQTIDDTLANLHPEVKELSIRQSHLYDAADPLYDAREAEVKAQQAAASQPHRLTKFVKPGTAVGAGLAGPGGAMAGSVIDEALEPVYNSAIKKLSGSTTSVPSATMQTQVPKIGGIKQAVGNVAKGALVANQLVPRPTDSQQNGLGNNVSNNKGNHDQIVSNSFIKSKPNAQGDWEVPTLTTPSGNYMTNAERMQREQNLDLNSPSDQKIYDQIERAYSVSQQQAKEDLGDKLPSYMRTAPQTIQGGNAIKKELEALPTNIFNKFNDWNEALDYAARSNPQYAQEIRDIMDYNSRYANAYEQVNNEKLQPNDKQLIHPSDPPNDAMQKLYAMQGFLVDNYQQHLEAWLALQSSSGVQSNTGKTVNSPAYVPNTATTGPSSGNVGFTAPGPQGSPY